MQSYRLAGHRNCGSAPAHRTPRRPWLAACILTLVIAGCARTPPPAPPPPPPPPLIVPPPPPRPEPPDGAAPSLVTPPVGADGQRESVNRKVSTNQIVWNLRSAYTVAALDCRDPRNIAILSHYRQFLERNAAVLKAVYDHMDHEFREKYGRGGETLRDDFLTVLYNHYALPPTKAEFCDVVDQVMTDGADLPPEQLGLFATAKVPVIEKVFDDFYDRYDKYRNALAAWEEKYGHVGRVHVEPLAQALAHQPPARPTFDPLGGQAPDPSLVQQQPPAMIVPPRPASLPASQQPSASPGIDPSLAAQQQAEPRQPAPQQQPAPLAAQQRGTAPSYGPPDAQPQPATPLAQQPAMQRLPDLLSGQSPSATP